MSLVTGAVTSAVQNQTTPQPRLVKAAHEFEAQMMKELLKPLSSQNALFGSDDEGDSSMGSEGTLGQYASECLGQAVSQHGGLGVANQIVHSLSHSGSNLSQKGTVT